MQPFHRTSDPSRSEQFCIRSRPVAVLSGTEYMGLLETEFPILRISDGGAPNFREFLYLRIRDSGAPNCSRGHEPFRADTAGQCVLYGNSAAKTPARACRL